MNEKVFDLKKRIFTYVLDVISFTKSLDKNYTNQIFVTQLIRCVTSIGANYEEADGSRSKKEFIAIVGIMKKEAKETKYWLEIIEATNQNMNLEQIGKLKNEIDELIKIIAKIIINSEKSLA